MSKEKRLWIIYSVSGLALIGLGLSVVGTAIELKIAESEWWFWVGTLGLVIFNSGIAVFGEAVVKSIRRKA